MEFFLTFLSFLTTEYYSKLQNKDNIFLAWLFLTISFITSPFDFLKICTLIMAFNILDFIISTFIQKRNNKPASSKISQIIIIDCGELNIDQMIVYPTVEQYQLPYEILTPITNLESHNSLSHHDNSPTITIELRKPTIEQLLCYPTIEQYHLKDNILKPTICSQTYQPEITSAILIHFGKPY
ncbi:hypothetical protein CDAR_487171 [Caerostris darwini]|uniref:Uncharacterized protein n=1 Tax=Caerostris darwini TaxID=1538125 RepID=A0AAV4UNW4_9ARAC|nr:hypothetical protein CDAR_487171 [Caerostris darwini]